MTTILLKAVCVFALVFIGALCISMSTDGYKKSNYPVFGWNLMVAFVCICGIVNVIF